MEKNPYESPSAKLTNGKAIHPEDIKPWRVTLVLIGLTLLVGVVMVMIEHLLKIDEIPGSQFISSFIPAYITGAYFANKYGDFMTRKTRMTAMGYVFALSLIIILPVMYFLFPEAKSLLTESPVWIWGMMVVVLLISFIASYAFIYLGEKTVIDANKKKSQQ